MKKIFKGLSIILALTFVFSAGVFASSTLESITAYLNHGIVIEYNDVVQEMTDANGQKVIPITYNGTTYLPVRAVSNMLGVKVDWDQETQTVLLGESFPNRVTSTPGSQDVEITPTQNTAPAGDITNKYLDFSFLYNAVQNAGNNKITLDPYVMGHLKDGKWVGTAHESNGETAYVFPALTFISTKGSNEIIETYSDLEKEIVNTLTANDYELAAIDEETNTKYYTKGTTEVRITNVNNTNTKLKIEVTTKWLSKYAKS